MTRKQDTARTTRRNRRKVDATMTTPAAHTDHPSTGEAPLTMDMLPPELREFVIRGNKLLPEMEMLPLIRQKLSDLERPKSRAQVMMAQIVAEKQRSAEKYQRQYTILNKLNEMELHEPEISLAADRVGLALVDHALTAAKDPQGLDMMTGLQVFSVLEQAKAKTYEARAMLDRFEAGASMLDGFQTRQDQMATKFATGVGFTIGGGLLVGISAAALGGTLPAAAVLALVGAITFGLGYWLYCQLTGPPVMQGDNPLLMAMSL